MESCAPGLTRWNLFFLFPFMEKIYPPVFTIMPASLEAEAVGKGIAKRAKVEQKGRMIFLYWEKMLHKLYLENLFNLANTYCLVTSHIHVTDSHMKVGLKAILYHRCLQRKIQTFKLLSKLGISIGQIFFLIHLLQRCLILAKSVVH